MDDALQSRQGPAITGLAHLDCHVAAPGEITWVEIDDVQGQVLLVIAHGFVVRPVAIDLVPAGNRVDMRGQ